MANAPIDQSWAGVQLLLDEAQRFHAGHPSSKRSPGSRSGASSLVSSANSTPDSSMEEIPIHSSPPEFCFWRQLRDHVAAHWDADPAPPQFKYHTVKQWLTGLDLWRLDVSWDECKLDAPVRRAATDARRRARLASLPAGQLFL